MDFTSPSGAKYELVTRPSQDRFQGHAHEREEISRKHLRECHIISVVILRICTASKASYHCLLLFQACQVQERFHHPCFDCTPLAIKSGEEVNQILVRRKERGRLGSTIRARPSLSSCLLAHAVHHPLTRALQLDLRNTNCI